MKIKINKVFGRHDIEFDTNTRCTIYIGENGIGKSTSMKIISNILNRNFVDILKFDFDSIDFFDEQVHYKIKYSDLYIDVDQMKNKFKYEIYDYANEQYENNMNNSDFEYDPYLKPCYDYLARNSDSYDRLIKNVFTGVNTPVTTIIASYNLLFNKKLIVNFLICNYTYIELLSKS